MIQVTLPAVYNPWFGMIKVRAFSCVNTNHNQIHEAQLTQGEPFPGNYGTKFHPYRGILGKMRVICLKGRAKGWDFLKWPFVSREGGILFSVNSDIDPHETNCVFFHDIMAKCHPGRKERAPLVNNGYSCDWRAPLSATSGKIKKLKITKFHLSWNMPKKNLIVHYDFR